LASRLSIRYQLEGGEGGFEDVEAAHGEVFGDGEGGGEADDVFVGDVEDEAMGEGGAGEGGGVGDIGASYV
jgi:hypothetical protein